MTTINNRYQIERKYIKLGNSRSGQKIKKVLFLVAHETANPTADAENHFKYFNNSQPSASAHTFIDDGKILEIVPLDEKAWHVRYDQDKKVLGLGAANDNAIGTELCRTGNFAKAYDRYVWYHAYLCKHFGLDPRKHLVSHKKLDPQRRSDPDSWLNPNGVTWDNFVGHVVDYYNRWDVEEKVEVAKPVTNVGYSLDTVPIKSPHTYRLAKFIDSSDPKVIEQYKKDGYRIIELPQ